ncbi:hypothetical protein [Sphingobacterium sp. LRF_L2]|uniref:hypothetical protein n=1 Tax=Sphingobacterium sp. LRF_L2 TaxID=3369421 RepID=UPI003F620D01
MRNYSIRIIIFVLKMILQHLDGGILTSFITEIFINGVVEVFKTLFNKHHAYYF